MIYFWCTCKSFLPLNQGTGFLTKTRFSVFCVIYLFFKDSDFEFSEELSNADSLSDDREDSDFDEAKGKTTLKGRGRGKSTGSPAKPTVKPRTSVTGSFANTLSLTTTQECTYTYSRFHTTSLSWKSLLRLNIL